MRAFVSIACAVALMGSASMAAAQGKSAPKVKTTAGAGTVHGKSTTSKPAAAAPKATGTVKTTGTAKTNGSPKTTASTKTTKATGHAKTTTTTTTATNTSATASAGTTVTLTPVQQKLQRNTNLASKLQSRLPGMDLNTAAAGFRNLGQFVAAVNVSNNLGLDFTTLKTAMVTDGKSLGQAIQSQKGTTVDATQEAQRAQTDADAMIRSTEKNGKKGTGNQRP